MDKLEKSIKDISNNYYDYLTSLQNVNGVGYGYKYINDKNTFEPCIHVLVEEKLDKKYISKNNLIPKSYMGIKTDVRAIGKIELTNQITNKYMYAKTRPLMPGASIAVLTKKTRGTLCCIVKKMIEIAPKIYVYAYYLLSNNHVLCDNGDIPKGAYVVQPSKEVGVKKEFNIVAAINTFIPLTNLEDTPDSSNIVDCGIARLIDPSLASNKVLGLKGRITGVAKAELEMTVNKVGSTTGVQQGTVKTLHATYTFTKLKFLKDKQVPFINQLGLDILSLAGDSGAPILTVDNKLVGMHMGRGELETALANDINNVFSELDVELYLEEKV